MYRPRRRHSAAYIYINVTDTVKKAIAVATRTQRQDSKHQASMCIICDRLIIGVECICSLAKQRILENQHRLSVKTYEELYGGDKLNSILAKQCHVEGLPGLLLSQRSYLNGANFECCSGCFSSLMSRKAKEAGNNPPKHAIANGFAICHIPSDFED